MAELFDGTVDDFRKVVPVTVNFTLEDVLAKLEEIEMQVLPKFLGDPLTEQLIGLLSQQQLTPSEKKALFLARKIVGCLGFEAYLPWCEVQIGNDGITVSASVDRKPAYEYQTKKLSRNLLDAGWQAMDDLIALVDMYPNAFPGWEESPYYQEHQDALFKNAADFSKSYPIRDRWLTFWALRPSIKAIEEDKGEAELERIEQLPSEVSEDQKKKLIRKLKRALAYQAVINALPVLSFELNGSNVQLNYASQYSNIDYFTPMGKGDRESITAMLQKQADLFLSSYEQDITSLEPAPDTTDDSLGTGLMYSNHAITLI